MDEHGDIEEDHGDDDEEGDDDIADDHSKVLHFELALIDAMGSHELASGGAEARVEEDEDDVGVADADAADEGGHSEKAGVVDEKL